jgi:hypothetical protein
MLLAEIDITNDFEFMDADSHAILVEYSNDALKLFKIE